MTEPVSRPTNAPPRERNVRPVTDLQASGLSRSSGDIGSIPEQEVPPATPRWVKAFVLIGIALVVLLAVVHLTGLAPTHGLPMHGMPTQ